ncbi:hypothetical protein LCGC14_2320350, partial [marine sediment metagenome]
GLSQARKALEEQRETERQVHEDAMRELDALEAEIRHSTEQLTRDLKALQRSTEQRTRDLKALREEINTDDGP